MAGCWLRVQRLITPATALRGVAESSGVSGGPSAHILSRCRFAATADGFGRKSTWYCSAGAQSVHGLASVELSSDKSRAWPNRELSGRTNQVEVEFATFGRQPKVVNAGRRATYRLAGSAAPHPRGPQVRHSSASAWLPALFPRIVFRISCTPILFWGLRPQGATAPLREAQPSGTALPPAPPPPKSFRVIAHLCSRRRAPVGCLYRLAPNGAPPGLPLSCTLLRLSFSCSGASQSSSPLLLQLLWRLGKPSPFVLCQTRLSHQLSNLRPYIVSKCPGSTFMPLATN